MKEEGYGISLSDLVMTMSGTMTPFVIALSRLGSLTSDFSLLGTHHGRILAEGHCQYWNRAGEKWGWRDGQAAASSPSASSSPRPSTQLMLSPCRLGPCQWLIPGRWAEEPVRWWR